MTKVDLDQEAFREGLFVRALGRPRSNNPYPPHSEESALWDMGWRTIDAGPEAIQSTALSVPLPKPTPTSTPGAVEDGSPHEDLGPRIVRLSRRDRLLDAALVLAFSALILGMWMLMSSR